MTDKTLDYISPIELRVAESIHTIVVANTTEISDFAITTIARGLTPNAAIESIKQFILNKYLWDLLYLDDDMKAKIHEVIHGELIATFFPEEKYPTNDEGTIETALFTGNVFDANLVVAIASAGE